MPKEERGLLKDVMVLPQSVVCSYKMIHSIAEAYKEVKTLNPLVFEMLRFIYESIFSHKGNVQVYETHYDFIEEIEENIVDEESEKKDDFLRPPRKPESVEINQTDSKYEHSTNVSDKQIVMSEPDKQIVKSEPDKQIAEIEKDKQMLVKIEYKKLNDTKNKAEYEIKESAPNKVVTELKDDGSHITSVILSKISPGESRGSGNKGKNKESFMSYQAGENATLVKMESKLDQNMTTIVKYFTKPKSEILGLISVRTGGIVKKKQGGSSLSDVDQIIYLEKPRSEAGGEKVSIGIFLCNSKKYKNLISFPNHRNLQRTIDSFKYDIFTNTIQIMIDSTTLLILFIPKEKPLEWFSNIVSNHVRVEFAAIDNKIKEIEAFGLIPLNENKTSFRLSAFVNFEENASKKYLFETLIEKDQQVTPPVYKLKQVTSDPPGKMVTDFNMTSYKIEQTEDLNKYVSTGGMVMDSIIREKGLMVAYFYRDDPIKSEYYLYFLSFHMEDICQKNGTEPHNQYKHPTKVTVNKFAINYAQRIGKKDFKMFFSAFPVLEKENGGLQDLNSKWSTGKEIQNYTRVVCISNQLDHNFIFGFDSEGAEKLHAMIKLQEVQKENVTLIKSFEPYIDITDSGNSYILQLLKDDNKTLREIKIKE